MLNGGTLEREMLECICEYNGIPVARTEITEIKYLGNGECIARAEYNGNVFPAYMRYSPETYIISEMEQ
jgi:hypothetical protein